MASLEKDPRRVSEKSGEVVRNAGIIAALIGTALWLARQPIGADIFVAGVVGVVAGEIGRRAAVVSNKK